MIPPYPFTIFDIQKYSQSKPRFNGVYSRDNLPKTKDGAFVINLDKYADVGTHWVALYVSKASPKDVNDNNATYFDSFGVEHIPKEIKAFINRPSSSALHKKNVTTNIFRIQACDSIMCCYFWIGFIDFMLAGKKLTFYTNLFSPYDFKKKDNIILSYFKYE